LHQDTPPAALDDPQHGAHLLEGIAVAPLQGAVIVRAVPVPGRITAGLGDRVPLEVANPFITREPYRLLREGVGILADQAKPLAGLSEAGTWIWPRNFTTHCKALLKRADIPQTFRVHDLRHTMVTTALNNGQPLAVVSKYVGHSSVSVTADIYGHRSDWAEWY
jgi:hypothetical protein